MDESTLSVNAESGGLCYVGEVAPADTRAIEAGLHELWRIAEAGEVGGSLVRAASMTLVVPARDEAHAEALGLVLDALAATHPCRVILVILDERAAEPRARLASHSRRPGEGEPARYWDEIRLVASRAAVHRAMSAVSTLVLPSLPAVTWWPGEPPFDDDLYHHVVELSDRILLDSSAFADPPRSLPPLAASLDANGETVAFGDLSWTRLTPWRLLVAEFFDAPADQDLLDSIRSVRVEVSVRAGGECAQALLFVGWLASRLGWEPRRCDDDGAGGWTIVMIDGVRPVEVVVARAADPAASDGRAPHPAASDGRAPAPGGLRAVTIRAAEDDRRATYRVERRGDEARTFKEDGDRLESVAQLPSDDELDLLREELGGFSTDRIYAESLALVARALGAADDPSDGARGGRGGAR